MADVVTSVKCSSGLGRILLVPTLFVVLIVLSKFGFAPLQSQWHTVVIIVTIYLIFIPFVSHNAFYNLCKAKKQLLDLEQEIDGYLLERQWSFEGVTRSIGSADHLFEQFENRLRNDHFASVAAGIFPTLGILGTFISIAISMPDFSVETSEALESEVARLLGGVGTAFYASIFGIFLSLWWVFFEKSGLSRFDQLLVELRAKTLRRTWSSDDLRLAELKQRDQIRSASHTIVQSLGSHEMLSQMHSIYEGYAALNDSVSALSNAFGEHTHKALSQMNRSHELMAVQSKLQNEVVERMEKLTADMVWQSTQNADVQLRYEKLLSLQEMLSASSQKMVQAHSEILEQVRHLNIEQAIGSLHEYSTMMHQSIQKMQQYSQAFKELHTNQENAYNVPMREGFQLIDREVAHVINRLSEVALEITRNGSHIAAALQSKR